MGQGWVIVNVDKKETLFESDSRLRGVLFDDPIYIYSCFTEFKWIPVTDIMNTLRINYTKYRGPKPLGRLQLPPEIICMIFAEIDDVSDVFCLGAANTRLMILGEKRLRELMPAPSWQGDRLICVAECTKNEELPEGILTQECQDFLRNPPNKSDVKNHWYDELIPEDFLDWVGLMFGAHDDRFMDKQRSMLMKNLDRTFRYNPTYHSFSLMLTDRSTRVPNKTDILWNLSKKVYVQKEVVLKLLCETSCNAREDWLMVVILLIQIRFASYDDTGVLTGDLLHGKWAGDRFEFTRKAVLDNRLKEKGGGEWKDVSEEAVRVFDDVFNALYAEEDRDEDRDEGRGEELYSWSEESF